MAPRSAVVVGGGILGLAVAELLSRQGTDVTLLEKETEWAVHQTGRNSGVIHAGPYYTPGSLKAAMCTAGNRSMTAFAREHSIPHEIGGKLIVAVTEADCGRLADLHDRSRANGIASRMLSADEAKQYEPNVRAVQALRVEATGIIGYGVVAHKLAELATANGAELIRNARVENIITTPAGITVEYEWQRVTAEVLVNCAGLHADRLALLSGVVPSVRIVPFRGEYYELRPNRRELVKGLIYPVPDPNLPFLGVHLTRMIDGSVHAGPNAVLALAREGYDWRTINARDAWESLTYPGFLRMASRNLKTGTQEVARSLSQRLFARSLSRLVPAIEARDIVRAGSGVRAQAVRRDGRLADDFVIQRAPRQIHVLNAPSPAATSALEIAHHLVRAIDTVSA